VTLLPLYLPQLLALAALSAALPRLWSQRKEVGAPTLAVLAALVLTWSVSDAFLLTDPDAVVALRISLLMWVLTPAVWFAFSLDYTGRRALLRRPAMWLVWGGAAGSSSLVLTSPWLHDLVWTPSPGGEPIWGPWIELQEWIEVAGLAGGVLVLTAHIGASPRGRDRLLAVVGIVVAAVVVQISDVGGTGPELPAAVWAATLALASLGLLREGAQDLSPVARSLVVEELRDIVVVLDRSGHIADLNRAATEELGLARYGPLPPELGAFWFGQPSAQDGEGEPTTREHLTLTARGGEERIYELSMVRLSKGTDAGRALLTLRDVTEAERLARELKARTAELSTANGELARMNARLERLANTDALTGVANRRRFMDRLAKEVERANRYGRPLSLLGLDLDHFKRINDTWGHPVGDEVLRRTGAILRDLGRDTDVPARLGGEEFAVLLPETEVGGATALAERIRRRIAAEEIEVEGRERFNVTVSVGVASLGGAATDGRALLKAADDALYRAKEMGRDRVCLPAGAS
jgi:diguanylate cyclase (GGDEF)-like protein